MSTSPISGGFQLTPVNGLNDTVAYPTTPVNETAARQEFMDMYWQLMNEMNLPTLSAAAYAQYNKLINGNFDVWQRGTSFSNPANASFTADKWSVEHDGTGATRTVSQQAFTLGQTDVPNEPKFFLQYAISAVGTGNTASYVTQKIESVRLFAGKKVTLSFYAKFDAARQLSVFLVQGFGTGGTPSANVTINPDSLGVLNVTTTFARYTLTFTLPSISGKTIGTNGDDRVQVYFQLPGNTVLTFGLSEVQLNAGNVALPFQPKDYEEELRKCLRYTLIPQGNIYLRMSTYNVDNLFFFIPTPTPMRINPTVRGTSADIDIVTMSGTVQTGFTTTVVSKHPNGVLIQCAKTAHGMTDGYINFKPASGFDAEL